MPKKIRRAIALLNYRKFPLLEFEKESDLYINYYPDYESSYELETGDCEQETVKTVIGILKYLEIRSLVFFGGTSKPWISAVTSKRRDVASLVKALNYFKKYKIEKKFKGAVKIDKDEYELFFPHFYELTKCDGGFENFYFSDEEQNILFLLHYSGTLHVLTMNVSWNERFKKMITKLK